MLVLVNTQTVEALIGKDKANVSRAGARGDLGKPVFRDGSKRPLYKLAAIERYAGHKFTPDEIEKARATKQHHFPVKRHDTAQALQELTVRVAKSFLRSRDLLWLKAIVKVGVSPAQLETIIETMADQIGAMARDFTNPQQEK